jgi:hypothetical protein
VTTGKDFGDAFEADDGSCLRHDQPGSSIGNDNAPVVSCCRRN